MPLTDNVWLIIIGLFIISCVAIKLFKFDMRGSIELFGLFLGVSQICQPTRISYKIFYITWSLIGNFVTQFYTASLSSSLIAGSNYKLTSIEDLIKSELKFISSEWTRDAYDSDDPKVEYTENDIYIKNHIKYISADAYYGMQGNLESGNITDSAYLQLQTFLDRYDVEKTYTLPEKVKLSILSCVVVRGFPHIKKLNKVVLRFTDTGLLNYWSEKYRIYVTLLTDYKKEDILGLKQLIPVFILIFVCYTIAMFVFLIENIYFHLTIKKKQKNFNLYLNNVSKRNKFYTKYLQNKCYKKRKPILNKISKNIMVYKKTKVLKKRKDTFI